jgi:TP901 family phage tail tape measure protein
MAFNISYIFQAIDNFTGVSDKISKSVSNLKENMSGMGQTMQNAQAKMQGLKEKSNQLGGELIGAAATFAAFAMPIKSAIDFEEAMANVRKVVEFDTPEQFKQMGKDILQLSRDIPLSAQALADIVASAGQFGIANDQLIDFTKTAAKMSVAFQMSAEQSGTAMAGMMNIFGLNVKQVEELADVMNFLGNTTNATERDILNVVTRTGNAAVNFGLAKEQAAALAASMLQLNIEPERASTAILDLVTKLQLIGTAAPEAQGAFKALGFDVKNFQALMKKDAAKALLSVSEAYSKMAKTDPQRIAAINEAIFGTGLQASNIFTLLSKSEKVSEVFNSLSKATGIAGSMQKEFETRSNTTKGSLEKLRSAISEISIQLGSVLLPALVSVAQVFASGAHAVADFAEQHPVLTKYIFGALVALTAFRVASIASMLVFTNLRIAAIAIGAAFSALPAIIGFCRAAMLALNLAMRANPIGIIITAIGILAAALYPIIESFGSLEAILSRIGSLAASVGNSVKQGFGWAFNKVAGMFGSGSLDVTANAALNPNMSLAAQSSMTESKSIVDINLKGNTDAVQSVQSKSSGLTALNVGQNMAYGGY